jgi:hypothetical protein
MARLLTLALAAVLASAPVSAEGLTDVAPPPPPSGEPAPPPPPPPAAEKAEWYVAEAGVTKGPFTLTQLRQAAQAGQVVGVTQVYRNPEGWRAAQDVPELRGYVAAAAPPPPPPPPPVDTQKKLDTMMQQFIVGTWRFEGNVTQGGYTAYVIAELTYRADMSVAGFQSVQFPGYGGMQPPPNITELKGRYTVTGIDEQNFTLVTTYVGGGQGNTTKLKIINRSTVENQADGARSHRVR